MFLRTEGPWGRAVGFAYHEVKGKKQAGKKTMVLCSCGHGSPVGISKTFHGNRWHVVITLHL